MQSASLTLYVTSRSNSNSLTAAVYPVLRSWNASYATWATVDGSTAWAAAGCNGVGTDRSGTAAASLTFAVASGSVTTPDLTALVQGWVTTPASNYGLLLRPTAGPPVSDPAIQADRWYTLDLVVARAGGQDQVTLYADGAAKITWTRGSGQTLTGGRVGVMVRGGAARFGELEQWDVGHVTKTYATGGQRIALRRDNALYFIYTDHLGSSSLLTTETGAAEPGTRLKYYAYGGPRPGSASSTHDAFARGYTPATYTGQTRDASTGLMYYGARFLDPALGIFLAPDSVVPEPGNPAALNRYSYVLGNPLRYRGSNRTHECRGLWARPAWSRPRSETKSPNAVILTVQRRDPQPQKPLRRLERQLLPRRLIRREPACLADIIARGHHPAHGLRAVEQQDSPLLTPSGQRRHRQQAHGPDVQAGLLRHLASQRLLR